MYIDTIQRAIEDSLATVRCYDQNSIKGNHEWINQYNPNGLKPADVNINRHPSILAPYQMCKFCHRRSNDIE